MVSLGSQVEVAVTCAALVVSAAVSVWGLVGKGQDEANKFGEPAAASSRLPLSVADSRTHMIGRMLAATAALSLLAGAAMAQDEVKVAPNVEALFHSEGPGARPQQAGRLPHREELLSRPATGRWPTSG